jgi:hypothetical protein
MELFCKQEGETKKNVSTGLVKPESAGEVERDSDLLRRSSDLKVRDYY